MDASTLKKSTLQIAYYFKIFMLDEWEVRSYSWNKSLSPYHRSHIIHLLVAKFTKVSVSSLECMS